jgi:hypothetical protein
MRLPPLFSFKNFTPRKVAQNRAISSAKTAFGLDYHPATRLAKRRIFPDDWAISAIEIIKQIKELPATEQLRVAQFIAETGGSPTLRKFSVRTEGDGLPVIRGDAGSITSQLVHEIESRTP